MGRTTHPIRTRLDASWSSRCSITRGRHHRPIVHRSQRLDHVGFTALGMQLARMMQRVGEVGTGLKGCSWLLKWSST